MKFKENPKLYHINYYTKRRKLLLDYLGDKCKKCGSVDNLQFDHINKDEKSFNIKNNLTLNEKVKNELDKCQLLCQKCHIEKTAKENSGFKHGTRYSWLKKKCECEECIAVKKIWYKQRNESRRKK